MKLNVMRSSIYFITLLIIWLIFYACAEKEATGNTSFLTSADALSASQIIEEAIQKNGLENFDSTAVSFRFRDKWYRYQRLNGRFNYERWWVDSISGERVRDVLDNDSLVRYIDGVEIPLEAKKRTAYANSVNSVVYFAFMPWALGDPSVEADFTGIDTIKGEPFLHLTIGFIPQDGHDHSDSYEYWLAPKDYDIRYLAYAHPSGRAPRFREAFNSRWIEGFRVRDYRNYTVPDNKELQVNLLADKYEEEDLVLLSVIEHDHFQLENIEARRKPMALSWWSKYSNHYE